MQKIEEFIGITCKEKQHIHELLKAQNYKQLYQTHAPVIHQMLLIDSEKDFEDFIRENNFLEESIFWLHYSAIHGESLLIGGYAGDVTNVVTTFFKGQLPNNLFEMIKKDIKQVYVDLDIQNNLEKRIHALNNHLEKNGYSIQFSYDDMYCAGEYFLWIKCL